jgi:phosphoglucosamine mutase
MSRKYFGTDGIRGRVGTQPITPDFILKLAYATGKVLAHNAQNLNYQKRPTVLIGKDTRLSGYMLESALEAGFIAAGVDTVLCGVLPTAGVAYLTRALRLQAGVVISASHNPYEDNGIKFFDGNGNKLSDKIEENIEAIIENPMDFSTPEYLGKAKRLDDAMGRYIEFCKSTFPYHLNLNDTSLVIDCAHGASYKIAPSVFHELGAKIVCIGNEPNGLNINLNCGATHTASLQNMMKNHQGYIGLSFDGDADRLQIIDDTGRLYNGDELLYVLALSQKLQGLRILGVVGTLMTNMGIEHALKRQGIDFVRAKVGDRYVLEQLHQRGWHYGGESSGHLLCLDKHTTGDGIIAALQVLAALKQHGLSLQQMLKDVELYHQHMINLILPQNVSWQNLYTQVQADIDKIEVALLQNNTGRLLIRPSGTEPKLRIMVEAQTESMAIEYAQTIAQCIQKHL